jgi:hypothetical protein
MAHHIPKSPHDQRQQRCTICMLFQSTGRGQYRSSYDREMYLQHLQVAHGVKMTHAQAQANPAPGKGDVLRE